MSAPGPAEPGPGFRLGFVPGATPAKWARTWQARHPRTPLHLVPVPAADAERALLEGELDAAILRPPVDREVMHAVVVYTEESAVVVSRDHLLAALEETETVQLADLADEVLLQPQDDTLHWAGSPGAPGEAPAPPGRPPQQVPATTPDAIALVAAGIGVAVMPRSLARLHHRKDVTVRTLADGPPSPVALAWVADREDELTEDMVGVVRGRTVNSSRGQREQATPPRAEQPDARRARRVAHRSGRTPPRRGRRRR